MMISSRVPASYNQVPVLQYLSSRFTYFSQQQWEERIKQGKIFCNDSVTTLCGIVHTHDMISYDMPEFDEPPADLNYSIVYEDQWLLGVNKPPNLLVHHKGKSFRSNLIYQLRRIHTPSYPQADIINRLDRETSGLVMVSKNKEMLTLMNRLLMQRQIQKKYYAVVHGQPSPPSGKIHLPIGRDTNSEIGYRYTVHGENAKEAITYFETIQPLKQNLSLVQLVPLTGRTHQLRVHMKALGHPIAGDVLYSLNDEKYLLWKKKPESIKKEMPLPRQALHCSQLQFIHPVTKKKCTLNAPFPDDMNTLL